MSQFDINILVNGNRCKTYNHNGRLYIEGKAGSEYEIEIKNHWGSRGEAVASVDGLSVMTGQPACDKDGGYIIDAYTSYRIKGFRYSDEKVGSFRFNYKDRSYANTKEDGSEINCGVIACKIFIEKTYPVVKKTFVPRTVWDEVWEYNSPTYGTSTSLPVSGASCTGGLYGQGRYGYSVSNASEPNCLRGMSNTISAQAVSSTETSTKEVFNLGTEWGSAKESRVVSATFLRSEYWESYEIYYTDREGLLALGIPLNAPTKINFPESFPGNYAQPPKGWRG